MSSAIRAWPSWTAWQTCPTINDMKPCLIVAIALLATATATADLADDVRCREIGFSQSVENQDIDAFRSFIDADARFVGAGVLRGVDQIAEGWSVFFKPGLPRIKWRPQIVEVLEDGRLALSRGLYVSTAANADGETVESWGTFNSIWRLNDDGVWRVVFDAGSPASGNPTEETRALLARQDDCP